MAKKLSIQIKLEGGKEIRQELADMGEEGKKAFNEINKAAKAAGGFDKLDPAKLAQFNAELKRAGVAAAELDKVTAAVNRASRTEQLVGAVRSVEQGFSTLTSTVKLAALAFGPMGLVIATVAEKVAGFVTSFTSMNQAITTADAEAIKLGVSFQKLQQLKLDFGNMGVGAEALAQGLSKANAAMDAAKIEQVATAMKELQKVMAAGSDPRTSSQFTVLLRLMQQIGPVGDAARKAFADLGIVLTAEEQRLQRMASSGVQSLAQLASGFQGVTVQGRAFASGLQQLRTGAGDGEATLRLFEQQLRNMAPGLERNRFATDQLGEALGTKLIQQIEAAEGSANKLDGAFTRLGASWDDLKLRLAQRVEASGAFEPLITALNFVSDRLQGKEWQGWASFAVQAITSVINKLGDLSKALGLAIWDTFSGAAMLAFNSVVEGIQVVIGKLGELAALVGGSIWEGFKIAGTAAVNAVIAAVETLIAKLIAAGRWMLGLGSGGGGGQTAAPGMAGGGMIGGRGTGTSDSNLAWVSRGEHIMPARAVSQPGVLAFLEALRRSGGNLSRVLDRMGHFATGGLVSMPAFAAGGGVGSMSHVTIAFPGLPAISGLRASSAVVEELQRAAAMAQVRSGGRKPSRYS
jgi:hypothetical protein